MSKLTFNFPPCTPETCTTAELTFFTHDSGGPALVNVYSADMPDNDNPIGSHNHIIENSVSVCNANVDPGSAVNCNVFNNRIPIEGCFYDIRKLFPYYGEEYIKNNKDAIMNELSEVFSDFRIYQHAYMTIKLCNPNIKFWYER